MIQPKTRACIYCDGSGKQIDDLATGELLRAERKAAGLTQTFVAEKLKFCKAYVHDLEKGKRHWSREKIVAYQKALQ